MHHLRSVNDVRTRIRNRNGTYAQWVGLFKRKQVPLCEYHHQLYHKSGLTHADMKVLRDYT